LGATLTGSVGWVIAKSPGFVPPSARADTVNVAVPGLEMVQDKIALFIPTVTVPNESDVGVTLSRGAVGAAPVPVRVAVALPAFEVTVNVALRAPVAVGTKLNGTVTEPPGAMLRGSVGFVIRKSPGFVPPNAIAETVNVAVPGLEIEQDKTALFIPTVTLPNATVVGDN
jgi:hypothetical protein